MCDAGASRHGVGHDLLLILLRVYVTASEDGYLTKCKNRNLKKTKKKFNKKIKKLKHVEWAPTKKKKLSGFRRSEETESPGLQFWPMF